MNTFDASATEKRRRREDGEPPGDIDPRTWHGASKLVDGAGGKVIAQKFKEVPLDQRGELHF